jgi:uncharacterized protein
LSEAGSTPPDTAEAQDPETEAFDGVCRQLAGFDPALHTEWVDGYLTALAASWRRIPLLECLPRLAEDAFDRAFSDPQDAQRATAVLQQRLETLWTALDPEVLIDDPDRLRLAPLMNVWDDEAREALVSEGHATAEEAVALLTGADWAHGFLAATSDFAADWPADAGRGDDDTLRAQLLETVEALTWTAEDPAFQRFAREGWKDANPTRDELIDEACFAVQDLRVWWLDHPPRQAPRRAEPVPGRNDPCPCGSGRKYKRCHGATAH